MSEWWMLPLIIWGGFWSLVGPLIWVSFVHGWPFGPRWRPPAAVLPESLRYIRVRNKDGVWGSIELDENAEYKVTLEKVTRD